MQKLAFPQLEWQPTAQASSQPLSLVEQPQRSKRYAMSPALSHILHEVRRELGTCGSDRLEKNDNNLSGSELEQLINRVAEKLGFELTNYERDELLAQVEAEQQPFGLLQPLVDNPEVTDIVVSNADKITVQQARKNYTTDLSFPNQEAYENFVERLLQRSSASYSTKKPIADGMIGSFARIHAVHRSICESGPYLTIRLNRFSAVSLNDLVQVGLAPQGVVDYLRAIVRCGKTVLVVGEVGTGKTTLVRALAASMPHHESILVIEDTPEIRLEHPHVRYITTREENSDGAGRVTPAQCIRAGMRMAMNRIVFGEIRDAEAAEAFIDVCASGHPGLSTIHARSAAEAVARLELFLGRAQKGVAANILSEQVVTALQVIVHVDICRTTGRRRIMQVRELGAVADGAIRHRDIFRYQFTKGVPVWRVVTKVSTHRDELEQIEGGVFLNAYPGHIELDQDVQYREAALSR